MHGQGGHKAIASSLLGGTRHGNWMEQEQAGSCARGHHLKWCDLNDSLMVELVQVLGIGRRQQGQAPPAHYHNLLLPNRCCQEGETHELGIL